MVSNDSFNRHDFERGTTPAHTDGSERAMTRNQFASSNFRRLRFFRATRQEIRFLPVGVSVSMLPVIATILFFTGALLTMGTLYSYVMALLAFVFGGIFFIWTRPIRHPDNYGYLELLFLFLAIILLLWVTTLEFGVLKFGSIRGMVLFTATLGYVQIIFSSQVNKMVGATFRKLQITDFLDALLLICLPMVWYTHWWIVRVDIDLITVESILFFSVWYLLVSIVTLPFTMWWLQTRNVGSLWIGIGSEIMRAGLLLMGHDIIWHQHTANGSVLLASVPFLLLFGDQVNRQILEIQDSQQINSSTLTPALAIMVSWLFIWYSPHYNMPDQYYSFLWFAGILCTVLVFIRVFVSNTIESRTHEKVQELISTDALTGVQNRRSLTALLNNFEGRIMMTDLDGFKSINDLYGHDQGDLILIRFTERLKSALGPTAKIFRLGGDEFAIVTPNSERTFEEEAQAVVLAGLDTVYSEPTVSVGGLYISRDMTQAEALRNTDIALQAAKAKGKNQFVILGGSLLQERARDLLIHTNISRIGLNSMWLEYQPVYSIGGTHRLMAVEALARWNDPSLGAISPSEFVPILENQGMAVDFGEVIIKKALAQARTWMELGTPVMVFINLSERHLRDEQDVEALIQTFDRIGNLSRWIGIEIKESFLQNPSIVENLWRVRSTGVSIGVDDFGAGSSIFPVLRKLPVDVIKLDRSLLAALLKQESARHILKVTLDMAVELDINVIVEGVEDEETSDAVIKLGSTLGQGFYWGRPQLPQNIRVPRIPLTLKRRDILSPNNLPQ